MAAAQEHTQHEGASNTKVADLLRFWNPEFLEHQLQHAAVMDALPAVSVRQRLGMRRKAIAGAEAGARDDAKANINL